MNPPGAPWASPAPPEFCKNHFVKPPIVSKEKSRKLKALNAALFWLFFFTLVRPRQCCGVFEKCQIAANNGGVTFLKGFCYK